MSLIKKKWLDLPIQAQLDILDSHVLDDSAIKHDADEIRLPSDDFSPENYSAPAGGDGQAAFVSIEDHFRGIDTKLGTVATAFTDIIDQLTYSSGNTLTLSQTPKTPAAVILIPQDGITQYYGVDYTVSGTTVTFVTGGDLKDKCTAGDKFQAIYRY